MHYSDKNCILKLLGSLRFENCNDCMYYKECSAIIKILDFIKKQEKRRMKNVGKKGC